MTIHPSVPPRTVIITGGNTGLGYACARAIAASHANWHIVIAYELSRRLQLEGYSTPEHPIAVNAFEPGLMPGTKLARDHGAFERFAWNVILPALRFALPNTHSPDASGKALARLVLDPALESITGKDFEGTRERASSEESYNQQEAAELWKASAELVKLLPTETILRVESSVDEYRTLITVGNGSLCRLTFLLTTAHLLATIHSRDKPFVGLRKEEHGVTKCQGTRICREAQCHPGCGDAIHCDQRL